MQQYLKMHILDSKVLKKA